jgi:hypothetical protein
VGAALQCIEDTTEGHGDDFVSPRARMSCIADRRPGARPSATSDENGVRSLRKHCRSAKTRVLVESSSRIARNVLSLQQGMRADDSDYEGANDLWRVSSDLSTLLQWIADLGLIANNIQSAADKAVVRIVLQKSATSVLLRQELMVKQANFALSRVRGAALVAEGRALRDEIDRLAQPCAN